MIDTSSVMFAQQALDRLQRGDAAALDGLIERSADRLKRLTHKMLADFPQLRRWVEADDVYQSAVLRLCRALKATTPDSPLSYYRLAALQIRRELVDLARHYFGPCGPGGLHASTPNPNDTSQGFEPPESTHNPGKLAEWTEFHETIQNLPEAEREVFDLLWYQELTQDEAADLLGVDVRTVQRRWQKARLELHAKLKDHARDSR